MNLNKLLRLFASFFLACSLASCGGGSGGTQTAGGVGTGGTGVAYGTVTGFGSLLVDDDTYSSATAEYFADNTQGDNAPTSSLAVALGQQVQIQLDNQGNPATVLIEPSVAGLVSAVNNASGTMVVNGVTIKINSGALAGPQTYFFGTSGLGALSPGMAVEVHGLYNEAGGIGYIQATRVELVTTASTRIMGVVSNLNPGAGTFMIGSTTVSYGPATSLLPQGSSLANGQLVNVVSAAPPTGGTLAASVLRIRSLNGGSVNTTISGLVAATSSGGRFSVSGITVVPGNPALPSPHVGDYVVVNGQPANDVLVAATLSVASGPLPTVSLNGTITGYAGGTTFTVRGVVVDASEANDGESTGLANGAYVNVIGSIHGNVVKASSVTINGTAPSESTVEYVGTVSGYNAAAGTFVLQVNGVGNFNVSLAGNIGFDNGQESKMSNGVLITVEATKTASGLLAYGISFGD